MHGELHRILFCTFLTIILLKSTLLSLICTGAKIVNKCPALQLNEGENLLLEDDDDDSCSPIEGETCENLRCESGKQCCFDACELKFVCLDEAHMVHSTSKSILT